MPYEVEYIAAELMVEPEELLDVFEAYFAETEELIAQGRNAAASHDCETLKAICHALKGSSTNLRMNTTGNLAAQAEMAIIEGHCQAAAALLGKAEQEVAIYRRQIAAYYRK